MECPFWTMRGGKLGGQNHQFCFHPQSREKWMECPFWTMRGGKRQALTPSRRPKSTVLLSPTIKGKMDGIQR